jgi:hypothetical protein
MAMELSAKQFAVWHLALGLEAFRVLAAPDGRNHFCIRTIAHEALKI